ncbi:MAG: hypothetical protein E4H32_05685 [Nitrospirales bacterium]|nr:MAG: hypothetical protein E4H32_05685 [Nitrospirales bacterium]
MIIFTPRGLSSASIYLGQAFILASLVTFLTIGSAIEPALAAPTADEVLKALPLSDGQKQDVLNGKVVKWTAQEAGERELAVGIVMLMKAPPRKPRNCSEELKDTSTLIPSLPRAVFQEKARKRTLPT